MWGERPVAVTATPDSVPGTERNLSITSDRAGLPLASAHVSTASRESRGGASSDSGISFQTLVIASLSSLAAAIVVHKLWKGGAIVGAAVTPVIVGIVGEALRRPAQRLTTVRDSSRRVPVEVDHDVPPASRERGDDPFGLWEDDRKGRSRGRTWLVLGIVTGVIGFAVAAFFLTGSELVFGGPVTGGARKTTIFGGSRTHTTTVQSTQTVTTVTRTTSTVPTVTQTVPVPAPQTTPTVPSATQPVPPAAQQQQAVPQTTPVDPSATTP